MTRHILMAALLVLVVTDLPGQFEVHVDASALARSWDVSPLGLNLNTLTDGDDNRVAGARPLSEAIAETGVTYLRFPGGEKSDVYEWAAPPYDDPATSGLLRKGDTLDWPFTDTRFWNKELDSWANDNYNFDDFMADCLATGAEPVISVAFDGMYKPPTELSTATLTKEQALEMAVEWVRYANVTHDYGIKYWMLGNETWKDETYAGVRPAWDVYGRDVAEFAAAMREVDPTILIGINGDNTNDLYTVLQECADVVDFIDVHTYPAFFYPPFAYYQDYTDYRDDLIDPIHMVNTAQAAIDRLSDKQLRDKLFVTVMETSATTFFVDDVVTPWLTGNHLGLSLANFDVMAQLLEDDRVKIAQYWNSRWINPDAGISHTYDLFTGTNELNASGQAVALLANEVLDGMLATESDGRVRTFATGSADGELLTIFLLNKATEASPTTLTVDGFVDLAVGSQSVFSGPSVSGVKTTYRDEETVILENNTILLDLPATSLTVLRFDRAQTGTTSLPVTLIEFDGVASGEGNRLWWSAQETGAFAGYGIERSTGDGDWQQLAFVPANTGPSPSTYEYTDTPGTTAYYRLRLQEADATFRYSPTIRLTGSPLNTFAYPNPTRGPVRLSRELVGRAFRVTNDMGRTVRTGRIAPSGIVSLSGLPGGIYHLILEDTTPFRVVKR
ncbi:hypothetical protein [Lewinella sp. IMCC34191]|uniref:hypothetical protein n=1 Tax=Lewinella sp. IMCC34191 TaxID=2259172 RepID=UPI00130062CF|nr:hypothetical protein [Lewinella sp. IMCC34191]